MLSFSELVPWVGAAVAAYVAWRGSRRSDFDSLLDELRKQLEDERKSREALEARVNELESRLASVRERLNHAYVYIRVLVSVIQHHNIPIPAPPDGLELHIDGKLRSDTDS